MFVDPAFVKDKPNFVSIITPLIYEHLCQTNGFDTVDKEQCIRNLEEFTKQKYLPIAPVITYYGQGISSGIVVDFNYTGYYADFAGVLSGFKQDKIEQTISDQLMNMIVI
jgi:hypothetical protein